jgi:hypothetical protein
MLDILEHMCYHNLASSSCLIWLGSARGLILRKRASFRLPAFLTNRLWPRRLILLTSLRAFSPSYSRISLSGNPVVSFEFLSNWNSNNSLAWCILLSVSMICSSYSLPESNTKRLNVSCIYSL